MSIEARQTVQAGLDRRKQERLFNTADMEAIGAVAGKRDRERKAQEDAQRRIQEQFAAEQQRIQQREEDLRLQEEAYMEERAESRRGLYKAVLLAGAICGCGGLHLIGAWRPEVAIATGGVLELAGLAVIVIALAVYYRHE